MSSQPPKDREAKIAAVPEIYRDQIRKAYVMWDALPPDLRELFEAEIRQNMAGTHVRSFSP